MKIGVKITLLAVVAALSLLITIYEGYRDMCKMDEMFSDIGELSVPNTLISTEMTTALLTLTSNNALYAYVRNDPQEVAKLRVIVAEQGKIISKCLAELKEKDYTEEGIRHLENISAKLVVSGAGRRQLEEYVDAGQWTEFIAYRGTEYWAAVSETIEAMQAYQKHLGDYTLHYCNVTSNEVAKDSEEFILATGVISLIVLVVVSFVIITSITKPLKKAVYAATQISQGNFDVDLASNSKDETGVLMQELTGVVQTVKNVVSDVNTLAKDVAAEGNFKARLETSKYKGSYRELAQGINKMVEDVTLPFEHTSEYLARIAKGDIPAKITTEEKGEFVVIRDSFNELFDELNLIVADINKSIEKATEGDFKYRADVSKHHGDYRKIMEGVNKLVEAFVMPLEVTGKFLADIEMGNAVEEPITVELNRLSPLFSLCLQHH